MTTSSLALLYQPLLSINLWENPNTEIKQLCDTDILPLPFTKNESVS